MSSPPKRPKPRQVIQSPSRPAEGAKTITTVQEYSFSGPLPPPQILARYNDVVQNGAERILAMAERQSAHRESMESKVVTGNLSLQRQGSWFAFFLALVTILGGVFLIYYGKNGAGLAAILLPLATLASVFFFSKHEQRKERVEKATALEARRRR